MNTKAYIVWPSLSMNVNLLKFEIQNIMRGCISRDAAEMHWSLRVKFALGPLGSHMTVASFLLSSKLWSLLGQIWEFMHIITILRVNWILMRLHPQVGAMYIHGVWHGDRMEYSNASCIFEFRCILQCESLASVHCEFDIRMPHSAATQCSRINQEFENAEDALRTYRHTKWSRLRTAGLRVSGWQSYYILHPTH